MTDSENKKTVSVQVKFSKDFRETHIADSLQNGLKSCGWWTFNRDKIKESKANFWVLVLYSLNIRNTQFVIIEPVELSGKLRKLRGDTNPIHSYLCVTKNEKCWETRGLGKREQSAIVKDEFHDEDRDFTKYLNNWTAIKSRLK